MKNILVATDFSTSAKNAADYAVNLAEFLQASVKLIHSFDVPFTFSDTGMQYIDIEDIEKNTEKALIEETERLKHLGLSVDITYQPCIGRIIDCLEDISEREKPEVIVFGMSGESESFLWGSTAVTALRSFNVPVLIVPKNAVWDGGINHICYAVNYHKLHDTTPFRHVREWARTFDGSLTVFTINQFREHAEPPLHLRESLQEAAPVYESVHSENFEKGFQEYLSARKFDLMIIIPQKHGFFDRLMGNSRSRHIARISSIPVLSFYER